LAPRTSYYEELVTVRMPTKRPPDCACDDHENG
jgi:hypothetical protein